MRLNALATLVIVSIGILAAGAAMTLAADGAPPRRGLFNFRAKPLEPTPAGKRPASLGKTSPAPARSHSASGSGHSGPSRGQPSNLTSISTTQTDPSPSAASRRLRGIRSATLDPDLENVTVQPDSAVGSNQPTNPAPALSKPAAKPTSNVRTAPQHRIATRPIPNQPARTQVVETSPSDTRPTSSGETVAIQPQTDRPVAAASETGRSAAARSVPTDDFLINSTGPAITVTASGPQKIIIGKAAVYTVVVANRGNTVAHDVAVDIGLPDWIEISGTESTVGTTGVETDVQQNSLMKWRIRQLAARSTERLELKFVPRDSRTIDLVVRWSFAPSDAVTQIEVQEPKLQLAVTGAEDVLFGDTKTYTITVSNPGTGDAENVVLNLLPVTPDAEAAGAREIGTLQAGQRRSIEIELTAHQAGRLQIRAHAFADGGLRAEGAQDVIVRRANLQVDAVGPAMKYSGTTATFKIRVANTGDATASNVELDAVLPAEAKFVGCTDGGKLDAQQGQVTWQIGSLRHGAARIFDLQCQLTASGENRLDVRSRATGDLSAARAVITNVEALADLKLYINDPKGAIPVGADSEYEVRIVNRGSKAAEEVRIVGFFGPGVEPISIQGWRGQLDTGQVEFETIDRLNAGQELVFKIVARADNPGTHRFRVEVTCTDPDTTLASEESTKYYGESTGTARQAMTTPSPIGTETAPVEVLR